VLKIRWTGQKTMDIQDFTLRILTRLAREVELVLDGLTPDDLNYRPKPDTNSIGWLIWHTARGQDRMNADLFGEDQLWVSEKWHLKFNRLPDQNDTGFGHSTEQVAAFHAPDSATLREYYRAVFKRTQNYITSRLSEEDLDRQVWSPTFKSTATVESRLIPIINNFQHVGQAGYVRGLLKGKGWYIA
jgi:hypothetical protein